MTHQKEFNRKMTFLINRLKKLENEKICEEDFLKLTLFKNVSSIKQLISIAEKRLMAGKMENISNVYLWNSVHNAFFKYLKSK